MVVVFMPPEQFALGPSWIWGPYIAPLDACAPDDRPIIPLNPPSPLVPPLEQT
jgi:hypothetical protein